MMAGDCGWGAERCAELAEQSSWILYMLANWPATFGFGILLLVVAFRLPADAWAALLSDSNPNKVGKP